MASGLCAALTGRTHGCTDQPANVKKTLANSEPSTHGTSETSTDVRPLSGSCGHQPAIADNRFMSARPHHIQDLVLPSRFDRNAHGPRATS